MSPQRTSSLGTDMTAWTVEGLVGHDRCSLETALILGGEHRPKSQRSAVVDELGVGAGWQVTVAAELDQEASFGFDTTTARSVIDGLQQTLQIFIVDPGTRRRALPARPGGPSLTGRER